MVRVRRLLVPAGGLLLAIGALFSVPPSTEVSIRPAAAVGWPISTGLMVAEVVTGGTSASDEYVEIVNAGSSTVDLNGVELVYVASASSSATRKAAWADPRPLAPGRHLVVANSSGAFAAMADATYSGGIAAGGGAVALRVTGGAVIDAVGWGDATNAFVERGPAAAPAAGASIERLPGGAGGNSSDTNDNALDWVGQSAPVAQNLAWTPLPLPTPSPTASPASTTAPSASPTASPSPVATPSDSPRATESPSATPGPSSTPGDSPAPSASPPPSQAPTEEPTQAQEPTPSASPEPMPTVEPSPTIETSPTPPPTPTVEPADSPSPVETAQPTSAPGPTDSPTPTPTPSPTSTPGPSPSPTPIAIAAARAVADGATVTVQGVLTTALGATDTARGAFVQDASAGIGIYLDDEVTDSLPRGTLVRLTGTLDHRFSQLVLRVSIADVVDLGGDVLPAADAIPTGSAVEPHEGERVVVEGAVIGSASQVSGGFSLAIDDGSGQTRVITTDVPSGLASGARVRAIGPLGQRDSSGTGTSGYRVYALDPGDLVVLEQSPTPTPTPTPSPSPTPSPTATPTPSPSPSPTPSSSSSSSPSPLPTPTTSPSPSPTPTVTATPVVTPIPINEARMRPIGAAVAVQGIVTAEEDRVGSEGLLMLQDGTAGIAVRLPDGQAGPARGTRLDVDGVLAAPYGQLEIRPAAGAWQALGSDVVPDPVAATGPLDESLEGRLIVIEGVVAASPTTTDSGDVNLDVIEGNGTRVRVQADVSSGIVASQLQRNQRYRLTGVVGQRATASGRLDGYRIWLRDHDDIEASTGPTPSTTASGPSPSASASPRPSPSPSPIPVIRIATAILAGGRVAVEGVVTAGSGLLDSDGRTIVIQDTSGAIEVRLPSGYWPLKAGRRLRVDGDSGRSYGAPRILAAEVNDLGPASLPAPVALLGEPSADLEWRLVRVAGEVRSVHRDGAQWRAEVGPADSSARRVDGLAGAKVPADRLSPGSVATIVGIVRRPYPTTTDRRFSILPRSSADITIKAGPPQPTAGSTATQRRAPAPAASSDPEGSTGGDTSGVVGAGASASTSDPATILDVDLVDLAHVVGMRVRVGGIVVGLAEDGFVLDDGTARATVHLPADALAFRDALVAGIALSIVATVAGGSEPSLSVATVDDLVAVGDLGGPPIDTAPAATADPAGQSQDTGGPAAAEPGDSTLAGEAGAPSGAGLVIGLLLSLAVVGLVALALGRRRPGTPMMAHPDRRPES